MKHIYIFLLLVSTNVLAQKATVDESVTYLGKTYRVGDIVHLGYGTGTNKDFAFINYGTSVGGLNVPGLYKKAKVDWSKAEVEIEKIEKKNGAVWLRCKPVNKNTSIGSILGGKIYINLEGAVDNNEVSGVNTKAVASRSEAVIKSSAPAEGNKQFASAPPPPALNQQAGTAPIPSSKAKNTAKRKK